MPTGPARVHRRAAWQARLRHRVHPRRRHARRQRPLPAHQCRRAPRGQPRQARRSISTRISTWSKPATAGPSIRSAATIARRQGLWPRRLRHEGRARRLDHRGGGLSGEPVRTSRARSRFPARSTRNPAASAASPIWPAGAISPSRSVDHVIIPEPLNKDRICLGHRGVWWAEIETKGEIAHGSMPFLGDSAIRHMGAVLAAFEEELYPGARPQADARCRWCPRARAARR